MPYVPQRTWLPLAPRIMGLSVKESPWGFQRGMGQGTCDLTDPNYLDCLAALQAGVSVNPLAGPAGASGAATANPASTGVSTAPVATSATAFFQTYGIWILLGGGALLMLAMASRR
jgi:hypothetical protein